MPGQRLEVIDEKLAIEMVVLVLDGPAEQLVGLVFNEFPFEVVGQDPDLLGATHLGVQSRQAQTAFFILDRRMPLARSRD